VKKIPPKTRNCFIRLQEGLIDDSRKKIDFNRLT
jgi:hypothetical protein